ncbi:MAG: HlyD family secretion protein [Amoebophilaceae bacterium]|nr:HlyD family secretion protein [Amoebophilaceae bacterium]
MIYLLIGHCDGILEQVHVDNQAWVAQHSPLATIQSGVSSAIIAALRTFLTDVAADLVKGHFAPDKYTSIKAPLGGMESSYHQLHYAVQDYIHYVQKNYYSAQLAHLKAQIAYDENSLALCKQQFVYMEQQLNHETTKYKSYQKLYRNKQMASIDFLAEETHYLQAKQAYIQQQKQGLDYQIALANRRHQYQTLRFERDEKREKLALLIGSLIKTLANEIHHWEQNYLITASIPGKVCYLGPWTTGTPLRSHQELFAIIPDNNAYLVYMQLPLQGFGKIKVGQKVIIKLFPYPYYEYGHLKGVVHAIDNIPHHAHYRVTVALTEGLHTTHNKVLLFKPDMEGVAEVVTEDISLLKRIFYTLLKLPKSA